MILPPTVLYDANVLYPSFLRDFLIRLARTGAVRARWTEAIHQEWIRSLLRNRPDLPPARLLALKDLINASVPDCLVENLARRINSLPARSRRPSRACGSARSRGRAHRHRQSRRLPSGDSAAARDFRPDPG
jgi:hypothetical protein